MNRPLRILLILIALVCFGVALSYPIQYELAKRSNDRDMAELSALRARARVSATAAATPTPEPASGAETTAVPEETTAPDGQTAQMGTQPPEPDMTQNTATAGLLPAGGQPGTDGNATAGVPQIPGQSGMNADETAEPPHPMAGVDGFAGLGQNDEQGARAPGNVAAPQSNDSLESGTQPVSSALQAGTAPSQGGQDANAAGPAQDMTAQTQAQRDVAGMPQAGGALAQGGEDTNAAGPAQDTTAQTQAQPNVAGMPQAGGSPAQGGEDANVAGLAQDTTAQTQAQPNVAAMPQAGVSPAQGGQDANVAGPAQVPTEQNQTQPNVADLPQNAVPGATNGAQSQSSAGPAEVPSGSEGGRTAATAGDPLSGGQPTPTSGAAAADWIGPQGQPTEGAPAQAGLLTPIPTPSPTPRPTPSPTPDRRVRSEPLPYPYKEKVVFDESLILDDMRDIYALNHDVVGWIVIDGTAVDYPVVQTKDEEYYLTHDFYGKENANGQIIMDYNCDPYTPSYNLIISGHHMNSGKMFGRLPDYSSKSYWEKHKLIEFDTLLEHKQYVIFAAFHSADYDVDEEGFRYNADIQYRMDAELWLDEVRRNQVYDTGIDVRFGDEFLTLTTCNRTRRKDGRFVVVARRIREGEMIQ